MVTNRSNSGINPKPIEDGIDFYAKTLVRTPITKTISNIDGDETLTEGTSNNISGAFFRKVDSLTPDKPGLFDGADAIFLIKIGTELNHNDKLTYEGETYRVEKPPVTRTLGGSKICLRADCFLI